MDQQEYYDKVKEIKSKAHDEICKLSVQYSKENRSAKCGDIITDHYHKIKVENVRVCFSIDGSKLPSEVYFGTVLKKDNTPTKNQKDNSIYACNIKEVIKS